MTPWQQHVIDWKDCRKCRLCDQRTHIVLARGSIPADCVMVGEAPGESENLIGQPFQGLAGIKLDGIVSEALENNTNGKLRIAYTNLVACFPREAKREGENEPLPDEIRACTPRLKEFINLCKPKLLVCVGGLAERYIHYAVDGELIAGGEVKDHPTLQRWASIVHPAHILRAPMAQKDMMTRKCVVVLRQAFESIIL